MKNFFSLLAFIFCLGFLTDANASPPPLETPQEDYTVEIASPMTIEMVATTAFETGDFITIELLRSPAMVWNESLEIGETMETYEMRRKQRYRSSWSDILNNSNSPPDINGLNYLSKHFRC